MTRSPGPKRPLRPAGKAPGPALPADLGRSLRWLDDEQLDRLIKAVTEEARRRGREVPAGPSEERQRQERPGPAKTPRVQSGVAQRKILFYGLCAVRHENQLTVHRFGRALVYMGEAPAGPIFRSEAGAFLAVTGIKRSVLGVAATGNPSFVAQLRRGMSPRRSTVERVRSWIAGQASAAERQASAAERQEIGERSGAGGPGRHIAVPMSYAARAHSRAGGQRQSAGARRAARGPSVCEHR